MLFQPSSHMGGLWHGFTNWLVVYLSLWNIWKSVGMMTFPIYGKSFKIPWFQTTNQILHLTLYSWFTLFHIMVDLSIIYQFTRGYINSCQHWFINIKIWKSVGVIIPNIRNSLGKTTDNWESIIFFFLHYMNILNQWWKKYSKPPLDSSSPSLWWQKWILWDPHCGQNHGQEHSHRLGRLKIWWCQPPTRTYL